MEIKITCGCGQKYSFEVDSANGQMPAAIQCPVCGADGTQEANAILARMFPEHTAGGAEERGAPAPAAVSEAPPRPASGLRLAVAANPPPAPAPSAASIPPPQIVSGRAPAAMAAARGEGEFSLARGIAGAVLGAGLGAGLMYGFFVLAGFRFPLMGTGIGALSGLGARVLARGTDSSLGAAAGVVAFLATAGTLYLMFGGMLGMFIISMAVSVYFAWKIAG